MINKLYHYKVHVTSVYDGDTFTGDIDLGFHLNMTRKKFRILRVNAPEVRGKEKEEGLKVAAVVRQMLEHKDVVIESKGTDSFGRILAEVYYLDSGQWTNLSDWLVKNKHAVYKSYK